MDTMGIDRRELLKRGFVAAGAGLAGPSLLGLLEACGGAASSTPSGSRPASPPTYPEFVARVSDSAYDAPLEAVSGLTAITLVNTGTQTHQLVFRRLLAGKTVADFKAAGFLASFAFLDDLGGVITPAPNSTHQVVVDLLEGSYILMSRGPEVAQGLITSLQVTAHASAAAPPLNAIKVVLNDRGPFTVPNPMKSGTQTWAVTAEGIYHHHMAMGRLLPDKVAGDVRAWIKSRQGPPPFTGAGGMHILSPGRTGWANLDLAPGAYAAWCDLPGPNAGQNHLDDLGEFFTFQVA